MFVTSIASSSSGNCTVVGSDEDVLLVDAGVSCKRIVSGLETMAISPNALKGILITHEHADHISGLKIFSKKYGIPIYGTPNTLTAIAKNDSKSEIPRTLYHPILPDEEFSIGAMRIIAFRNSHDAADPVGYRIAYGEKKIAVATDLGNYTEYTVNYLTGLNALLIESNHDIRMLEVGPYPFPLKRRILSDYGHLSNDACASLLLKIIHPELKGILLGHLSQENNMEQIAYETICQAIDSSELPYTSKEFNIHVAHKDRLSATIRTDD